MNYSSQFEDALDSSSFRKVIVKIALCIFAGAVLDRVLMPPAFIGALTIMTPFCFIAYFAFRFQASSTEEKNLRLDNQDKLKQAYLKYKGQAEKATAKLDGLEGEVLNLRTNIASDRKALASVTDKYGTCKDQLVRCQSELAKCQADYQQVLDSASQLSQDSKALANENKALAEKIKHLQDQVEASEHKAMDKWQDERKKLIAKCQTLTPYFEFYKQFEAYKGAESIARSSKSSDKEKEGAKAVFDKAKDAMITFYKERITE